MRALGLVAMVMCLGSPLAAQQLTVQANDRKFNGQVWDGAEVYAPVALPANTPPDLAICIVPLNGIEHCTERVDGRTRKSQCQNSLSCTFDLRVNFREPFGVFIYDIDVRYDDLVDTLIVVPDERTPPDRYRVIEARLRELMETRTRAFTPMEKDRRARETFVVSRERCKDSCTLAQSRVRFH